jgi:hypothetical protein
VTTDPLLMLVGWVASAAYPFALPRVRTMFREILSDLWPSE